jgi:hypothetical protein
VHAKNAELPSHLEYVVSCDEGEWIITLLDSRLSSHDCESKALRSAIEAARDAGVRGYRAEVLVRERGNFLRQAWTFGLDPFPPPERD